MTAGACPSCGAAVIPSDQFCASCGAPVSAPEPGWQPVAPDAGVPSEEPTTGSGDHLAGPSAGTPSAAHPWQAGVAGPAVTGTAQPPPRPAAPWPGPVDALPPTPPTGPGPVASGAPGGAAPAPWVRRLDPDRPAVRRRRGLLVPVVALAAVALIAVAAVLIGTRGSGSDRAGTASRATTVPAELGEPSATPTTTAPSTTTATPTATATATTDRARPSSDTPTRTSVPTGQASPASPSGDLGLTTPISRPACSGQWVVFVGAATTPGRHAADVDQLLGTHPGSEYLLTEGSCSSLRQRLDDGGLIYAVYVGYFADQAAACAARDDIGGSAYVKLLDDVTPADQLWQC